MRAALGVTPAFRAELAALLPGLGENVGHWRLLGRLLFSGSCKEIPLPFAEVLADYGDRSHRTGALDHIESFSRDVFPIKASSWSWGHWTEPDAPRRVESMSPPKELRALVKAEAARPATGLVRLDDGRPYVPNTAMEDRRAEAERRAERRFGQCRKHEALRVADYLNSLPTHRFTKLRRNLGAAREEALALGSPAREQQLMMLRSVELDPMPLYAPSARSTRLYPVGPSFLGLQGDVRDALVGEWTRLDLASCHMAVACATWGGGMPKVRGFLEAKREDSTRASLWRELADWMDVPLDAASKGALKESVYSLMYGMGRVGLQEQIAQELPHAEGGFRRFVAHPIIGECWRLRKKEIERLKEAGHGTDAFGEAISPKARDDGEPNWPSVLAVCAQSYELALLLPVYDLAANRRDDHGFSVVYHLHDGIGVVAHHRDETESWAKRIGKVVDEEAERRGIPTWLERQT